MVASFTRIIAPKSEALDICLQASAPRIKQIAVCRRVWRGGIRRPTSRSCDLVSVSLFMSYGTEQAVPVSNESPQTVWHANLFTPGQGNWITNGSLSTMSLQNGVTPKLCRSVGALTWFKTSSTRTTRGDISLMFSFNVPSSNV
jgi:hypothetical protein